MHTTWGLTVRDSQVQFADKVPPLQPQLDMSPAVSHHGGTLGCMVGMSWGLRVTLLL